MTENLKKLETLSYEPICSRCQKASCQCRKVLLKEVANTSPATMGFNSAVIKPEMRVNKREIAKQILEQSNKLEQPNQNLMIIEEIEGLISQVNEKLMSIGVTTEYENHKGWTSIAQALEEIDLFQKTTLFELRRAFE